MYLRIQAMDQGQALPRRHRCLCRIFLSADALVRALPRCFRKFLATATCLLVTCPWCVSWFCLAPFFPFPHSNNSAGRKPKPVMRASHAHPVQERPTDLRVRELRALLLISPQRACRGCPGAGNAGRVVFRQNVSRHWMQRGNRHIEHWCDCDLVLIHSIHSPDLFLYI
jgi:hypothetical protein